MKFILTLSFLLLPSAASAAFPDVPKTYPNYDAINYVQSEGIVDGYPDGTYKPERVINRAEFIKIIVETMFSIVFDDKKTQVQALSRELQDCTKGPVSFSDVATGTWYAGYICIGKGGDMIKGYPDYTFKPANAITFAETASVLAQSVQVLEFLGNTKKPLSLAPSTPWYKAPVTYLADRNAIPDSITRFHDPITRGEMAEIIYRLRTKNTGKKSRSYTEIQ
jgi:hypothetical protein